MRGRAAMSDARQFDIEDDGRVAASAVSGVIGDLRHTSLAGAVSAAVEGAVRLDAMANDLATTMIADRRQLVDGALKTIKYMALASGNHLERQVIVVPANFTRSHGWPPYYSLFALIVASCLPPYLDNWPKRHA